MKYLNQIDFDGMKLELLGTFAVVYMGGWAYINYFLDVNDFVSVGMTHLFAYALFVWAGYSISGGLYNPGLTMILIFFKRLNFVRGLFYIASQLIGSLLAASLLKLLSPEVNMNKLRDGGNLLGFPKSKVNVVSLAIYEAVGGFFVVLVYYMVALAQDKKNAQVHGMSMGAVYFTNVMVYGVQTGGAANIARIFGPAFISKDFWGLLFSSAGSLGGSIMAAMLCEKIILKDMVIVNQAEERQEMLVKQDEEADPSDATPGQGKTYIPNPEDSYDMRHDLSAELEARPGDISMQL